MSTPKQTTQESKPPAWAAPLFQTSAKEATRIYNSGAGGSVYKGDTTAGLGALTQSGIAGVGDSANYLKDYASGQYLNGASPYKERLNNEIQDSNALVQSAFSGSGRYGSGANTGVLAKNTNNMLLQGLENDYNRQQANQFQAANYLLGANQAKMQAGQVQDASRQADLNEAQNRFLANDNKDWTRLGLLQSAAQGSAGNYGTQQSTQSGGTNLLSAVGSIGSLATKSDARLKENIVPVGIENGLSVYEFNYIGDDTTYHGVMAQDLLETHPEAVVMEDDGFLAVQYDVLGIMMRRV